MLDSIKQYGIPRTVKSIFPNLKGIDFESVEFDSKLNSSNPLKYLTNDIDGDWYFGIGSMAMIFKAVSKTKKTKVLSDLLKSNGISKSSAYTLELTKDIKFWKGNGFKIEMVSIENQFVILITNENFIPAESLELKDTKLAKKITSPDWIRGIDKMYDGDSVLKKNKALTNFINVSLLFREKDLEYILISVQTFEIAKNIIDSIIEKNGGKDSFKLIDKNKDYQHLYDGFVFFIGYMKSYGCIRIEAKPKTFKSADGSELKRGIHPLSDKINKLVKGLNSPIFNAGDGGMPDGRFYTTSEKANVIISFSNNANRSINKFNEIVLEHNDQDKILKIKNSSVKKWLDENPEDFIEFKVKDKFQIHLSKGNALYRINLYPGGGLASNWSFSKKMNINEIPESTASQVINITEEKYEINEVKEPVKKKEPKKISKKDAFLKKATITSKEKNVLNKESKLNKLKEKLDFTDKNYDFSFIKRILKILFILLLLYFLFKACSDPCKNNAVCYYEKGLESEQKIEYDEAFKYYKKAIRVDRKYIDAYITRGNLYQKLNKDDKAVEDFTKVIEIDDKYWEAYFHRANSYVKLGGEKKYSIQFRKAMKDYDESIEIYDGNENAASFYNRGLLKEKIEIEACDDFVFSCDREYSDGCYRYNNLCYPKTGDLSLFNEFGRGVYQNSSNNKFILDNSLGEEDLVVVIRNYFTNTRVRAQFVRKGATLTMDKIPNGTFYTQDYMGNYWIKNLDPKNRFMRDYKFLDFKKYPVRMFSGKKMTYTYNKPGGNLQGENMTEEEFFN